MKKKYHHTVEPIDAVERDGHRPSGNHANITVMTALVLSMLIGVIAGLRAMTAPAAVSWAARLGWLNLAPTGLAFLGYAYTPWIFTALALAELVTDQLPTTPSRTVPIQFGTRIMSAPCAVVPSAPARERSSLG